MRSSMSSDVVDGVSDVLKGIDCWVAQTHLGLPGLLGREAQRDQGRVEPAENGHGDGQETQDHGCGHHDVPKAPQPDLLPQRGRAGRAHRRDDLAAFVVDNLPPLLELHGVDGLQVRVVGIVEAESAGDPFQLLPSRIVGPEMPTGVLEQAGQLTEHVLRRCQVEQVHLGRVQVAHGPFPQGSGARQVQQLVGVQRLDPGGLAGGLQMESHCVQQDLGARSRMADPDPGTEELQLHRAGQGPFPPRGRDRTADLRRVIAPPGGRRGHRLRGTGGADGAGGRGLAGRIGRRSGRLQCAHRDHPPDRPGRL